MNNTMQSTPALMVNERAALLHPAEPLLPVCPWAPRSGPLVVVSVRPLEETFAVGGLMASFVQLTHPVLVVSVSDGEAAHRGWHGLATVRRQELREALHVLGGGAILSARIGLPDGEVHFHERYLSDFLARVLPTRATVLSPYAIPDSSDHQAVERVCRQLCSARTLPLARYYPPRADAIDGIARQQWRGFDLGAEALALKERALACGASLRRSAFRGPLLTSQDDWSARQPYEFFLV